MTPYRDISEEQWQRIAPLLPELRPRAEMRGRPLANTRQVLNGVLWVMYSGATWSAMPRRYPSYQTCHRRFKAWHDDGVLKRVMSELFGPEGVILCDAIEGRMRRHPSREEKAERARRDAEQRTRLIGTPFIATDPEAARRASVAAAQAIQAVAVPANAAAVVSVVAVTAAAPAASSEQSGTRTACRGASPSHPAHAVVKSPGQFS